MNNKRKNSDVINYSCKRVKFRDDHDMIGNDNVTNYLCTLKKIEDNGDVIKPIGNNCDMMENDNDMETIINLMHGSKIQDPINITKCIEEEQWNEINQLKYKIDKMKDDKKLMMKKIQSLEQKNNECCIFIEKIKEKIEILYDNDNILSSAINDLKTQGVSHYNNSPSSNNWGTYIN